MGDGRGGCVIDVSHTHTHRRGDRCLEEHNGRGEPTGVDHLTSVLEGDFLEGLDGFLGGPGTQGLARVHRGDFGAQTWHHATPHYISRLCGGCRGFKDSGVFGSKMGRGEGSVGNHRAWPCGEEMVDGAASQHRGFFKKRAPGVYQTRGEGTASARRRGENGAHSLQKIVAKGGM